MKLIVMPAALVAVFLAMPAFADSFQFRLNELRIYPDGRFSLYSGNCFQYKLDPFLLQFSGGVTDFYYNTESSARGFLSSSLLLPLQFSKSLSLQFGPRSTVASDGNLGTSFEIGPVLRLGSERQFQIGVGTSLGLFSFGKPNRNLLAPFDDSIFKGAPPSGFFGFQMEI